MLYAAPKALFYALSKSARLKQVASRYGLARSDSFARRFIAGETIEEAVAVAKTLESRSLLLTLDYLGESVRTREAATAATNEYLRLIDVIVRSGIERNLSLKLTQLGVDVDRATCIDNLRRILDPATRHDFFVRIDMEGSRYTDVTLQTFYTLWQQQYRCIGVALQAYLRRTQGDVEQMNALGARVRLVKGAYKEPASVAYQKASEVNDAYRRLTRLLLDGGTYPAIATHDEDLLEDTCAYAANAGISPDRFEFQLLYGIRRDQQRSLVERGYHVRIYVPFGREWFAYFMRRLGERPENVAFVIRGVLGER